jgi:chromate transporter
MGAVLAGIAPVVVAIVAHATVVLGRAALRRPIEVAIGAAALAASLAGLSEIAILGVGGILGLLLAPSGRAAVAGRLPGFLAPGLLAVGGQTGAAIAVGGPVGLFAAFFKIGSILFGSGYLLVALLRSEFVVGNGLLTEQQLLDAVAVGQVTPGPVFTTATFVGYLALGPSGALIATFGIALPALAFVALSLPVLERLRGSAAARAALDGVGAAVVGLLVAVTAALTRTAVGTPVALVLAATAFVLLMAGRLGPVPLIALGAVVGLAMGAAPRA